MSPEPRFVFDTSTIISALLFDDSTPGEAFHAALGTGRILLSDETFAELSQVVRREKFDRYTSRPKREQFLVRLLREATLVDIINEIRESRDPDDDKFLELAVSGNASCIISSDQDLLVLKSIRGIPILTPSEVLAWLEGRS
jgi:uncharacterized protein